MTTDIERIPVTTIDGAATTLGYYTGKVRLVVNVASKCGLTVQYAALEALYRKYRDRGFEVLAFPANDFAGQEPGTEAEIKDFCSTHYDVSFPMFGKVVVKGDARHPLYAKLTSARPEARSVPGSRFRASLERHGLTGAPSDVLWNFEKFLVDREGNVIDRFASDVTPDADIVVSAIERAISGRALEARAAAPPPAF